MAKRKRNRRPFDVTRKELALLYKDHEGGHAEAAAAVYVPGPTYDDVTITEEALLAMAAAEVADVLALDTRAMAAGYPPGSGEYAYSAVQMLWAARAVFCYAKWERGEDVPVEARTHLQRVPPLSMQTHPLYPALRQSLHAFRRMGAVLATLEPDDSKGFHAKALQFINGNATVVEEIVGAMHDCPDAEPADQPLSPGLMVQQRAAMDQGEAEIQDTPSLAEYAAEHEHQCGPECGPGPEDDDPLWVPDGLEMKLRTVTYEGPGGTLTLDLFEPEPALPEDLLVDPDALFEMVVGETVELLARTLSKLPLDEALVQREQTTLWAASAARASVDMAYTGGSYLAGQYYDPSEHPAGALLMRCRNAFVQLYSLTCPLEPELQEWSGEPYPDPPEQLFEANATPTRHEVFESQVTWNAMAYQRLGMFIDAAIKKEEEDADGRDPELR